VGGRITFAGRLDEDADAASRTVRAVCFAPLRGLRVHAVEAFASAKAVVTCSDSGGPAELVRHDDSGFVCEPTPSALGAALARLMDDRGLAERLGRAALAQAAAMTWPEAVKRLVIV
jgi:glycosyltransferase involved in cell wall biosynthesis